jgi:two-component system chemotaxis sensor kinase CheA
LNANIDEFAEVFHLEAAEDLATLQGLLSGIDPRRAADREMLDAIFQAACCVKASSATLGLADVAELAHQLEGLLDRLRKREIALTARTIGAALEAAEAVKALLAAHRGQATAETGLGERVRLRLERLARDATGTADEAWRAETRERKCRRACKPARARRGSA